MYRANYNSLGNLGDTRSRISNQFLLSVSSSCRVSQTTTFQTDNFTGSLHVLFAAQATISTIIYIRVLP